MANQHSSLPSSTVDAQQDQDSMWALVVDGDEWDLHKGFRKTRVPRPQLDELQTPQDSIRLK